MLISEGVYMAANPIDCPLRTINTYLLKDGRDAYLVDTGWPARLSRSVMGVPPLYDSWDMLMELLHEADVSPDELSGLILTHSHMDHAAYAPSLQALSGAPLLISRQELAENDQMSRDDTKRHQITLSWFLRNGVPQDIAVRMGEKSIIQPRVPRDKLRLVEDGEVIPVGRMRWEVIWTPGHTLGQICLLERERGLLLCGDHILPNETPIIMTTPIMYEVHPNPLGSYDWALHRMQGLPVRLALPGHGRVMPDFQQIVARQLAHHDTRYDDLMAALLEHGQQSSYFLCCEIPWAGRRLHFDQLRTTDQLFAFSEALCHLRSLEGQGMVECVSGADGQISWRLTGLGKEQHLAFVAQQQK